MCQAACDLSSPGALRMEGILLTGDRLMFNRSTPLAALRGTSALLTLPTTYSSHYTDYLLPTTTTCHPLLPAIPTACYLLEACYTYYLLLTTTCYLLLPAIPTNCYLLLPAAHYYLLLTATCHLLLPATCCLQLPATYNCLRLTTTY